MRVVWVVWASLCVLLASPSAVAQVDEDRLRLMHETISYTDVVDAHDGPDPFDLHAHFDYARVRDTATVYREQTLDDGTRGVTKIADSKREVSQLAIGLDVGLYKDLMAFVRMPLVLSDARALSLAQGVTAQQAELALGAVGGQGALFNLPFAAPTRAGLDYLAVGGAWAVLSQVRRSWQPNWVLRLEGRRAVGKVLQPCVQEKAKELCGSLSSEDRDGDGDPDGTRSTSPHPGLSRGVSALLFETRFSRRLRSAEPYAGLSVLVEWPALRTVAREAFQPADYGRARPGPQGAGTLGVALIPWEDRGSYQRLVLDLRLSATYVAPGTDYSPLFDALGSSSNPTLAASRAGVSFRGLTEAEGYLRYGGQLSLEIQAARYVRFGIGSWLHWLTEHAITGRDPCRGPEHNNAAVAADGRICTGGKPDARERGEIDAVGRRFILRDQLLLGVFAQATATF